MTHKYIGFRDGPRVKTVSEASTIVYEQIVGVSVTKKTKQDSSKKLQKGTVGVQQVVSEQLNYKAIGEYYKSIAMMSMPHVH